MLNRYIAGLVFSLFFSLHAPDFARSQELPIIALNHEVEENQFSTDMQVKIGAYINGVAPFSAFLNLNELGPVLNKLANEVRINKVTHTGTILSAEANLLRVKIHLKYDAGFFLGNTNGSVVIHFKIATTDASVSLVTHSVELNISNDIVRIGSDLSGFRDATKSKFVSFLERALSSENARLAIPENLETAGVKFEHAYFEQIDGHPHAVVKGQIPSKIRIKY